MGTTHRNVTVYRGVRKQNSTAGEIIKRDPDGREFQLDPRLDLANKSPTGLNWGYKGSGPAQASIAILADAYDDETAMKYYREFLNNFLATLHQDEGFVLEEGEIPRHLPESVGTP